LLAGNAFEATFAQKNSFHAAQRHGIQKASLYVEGIMTKMKKILLSVAGLLCLAPFATPAGAQVVVRVGPRYHHHYYHHRYYHHHCYHC